jgi:very-short-patch-repair endonuclease
LFVAVEWEVVGADRLAQAVARRQQGVVTYAQLLGAGLRPDMVRHREASGWLRRVLRGVYLVGAVEPPLALPMAAVLSLGEGSLLSHYPAAVFWGLRPAPMGEMHVTVVARDARGPGSVRVHRVNQLHPADATSHHGIPATSPARNLLDLATQLDARDLSRAVDEARVNRLASDRSLDEQFSRDPHHRGTTALRRALGEDPALTRSEAERRLLELIRMARLPPPQSNTRVSGYEVDLLWPDHGLIVEIDGYAFHSTRAAFERDRRRDAHLQANGYRVLRVIWRQITDETAELIAVLARATAASHTPKR